MGIATVEPAVLFRQQAGEYGTQRAADAVYRNGADRIVDFQLLVDEFNGIDYDNSGNEADSERAGYGDQVAASCNSYQTCQCSVQCHGNVRLSVADPGQEHDGAGGDSGGHVGGYENVGGRLDRFVTGHADGRTAVEAEPGEPEYEHTQGRKGQTVAGNSVDSSVFIVFADTGPQQPGADAGTDAAYHMHRGGTGKIVKAHLGQPAAAPDPVAGNRVDDQADEDAVNAVGRKFCTFCHGPGNDGGGRRAENSLEDQKCHGGIAGIFRNGKMFCKKIRTADDAVNICPKHESEADDPEYRRTQSEVHHIFHNDIACVFSAGQTRFAHGKTWLHKKYQGGAQQHPDRVCRRISQGKWVRCKSRRGNQAEAKYGRNNLKQ